MSGIETQRPSIWPVLIGVITFFVFMVVLRGIGVFLQFPASLILGVIAKVVVRKFIDSRNGDVA